MSGQPRSGLEAASPAAGADRFGAEQGIKHADSLIHIIYHNIHITLYSTHTHIITLIYVFNICR